jgi:hypothetical protein
MGLGNLAQALAWVALFLRASPVRAPENAGAIHIDRTQIQMTISFVPSGLIAFIIKPTQAKAWAKFPRPFGPKPVPKSDRLPGVQALRNPGLVPNNVYRSEGA